MKITHIHSNVGGFSGALFFVIDNKRLLKVNVETPNFNDYNQWRLTDFKLSPELYNPKNETINRSAIEFEDIEINEDDLRMIEFGSNIFSGKIMDDEEIDRLSEEFPDINSIYGVMYKGRERMTIGEISDGTRDSEIYLGDIVDEYQTSFQKVFYIILERFRIGYLKQHNII